MTASLVGPQPERAGIAPGADLFELDRLRMLEGAAVADLGETYYRGDRYRFHATLVRERRPGGGKTG